MILRLFSSETSFDPPGSRRRKRPFQLFLVILVLLAGALYGSTATASDHADPFDPLNLERLEGGITDLFVFPVDKNDKPVAPETSRPAGLPLANPLTDVVRERLTAKQKSEIASIVFILCVRRALTDEASLSLEPYTYKIRIDINSVVEFPTQDDYKQELKLAEARKKMASEGGGYATGAKSDDSSRPTLLESFARYGGRIPSPEAISEEITMEFKLHNNATFQDGYPKFTGAGAAGWGNNAAISSASGVFDDPFIFPAFFGTNVVAMAVKVPITSFDPAGQDLVVWATSEKGSRQVDHVGRSLRTQNPRFELLNTKHPSEHVKLIQDENKNPSLMRDIFLRLNFAQAFAYRKWDFVPDVLCYSTNYAVGYPNGRLLKDDVAAMLAQHGDTLLYELSYQHPNGQWPRQTVNDTNQGEFQPTFPYLNEPHKNPKPPTPLRLTNASIMKLLGIALLLLVLLILENWIVAKIYHRIKIRKRNL